MIHWFTLNSSSLIFNFNEKKLNWSLPERKIQVPVAFIHLENHFLLKYPKLFYENKYNIKRWNIMKNSITNIPSFDDPQYLISDIQFFFNDINKPT